MMPTPLIVWALRAAHTPRSGDQPANTAPKDRRPPTRLVRNDADKPARQSTTLHLIHTKER